MGGRITGGGRTVGSTLMSQLGVVTFAHFGLVESYLDLLVAAPFRPFDAA